MRNELFSASGAEVSFWHRRQVGGMSLPAYLLVSALVLLAAVTGALPSNMVGALAVMLVLGNLFDFIGGHIPIVRSYLGGAVFCIFAASAAATFGLLPASVTENCTHFINDVGFLDFFISTLITGSILGMDRELLKRAAVRFLPVTFLSMACAAAVAGLVGAATGQGFRETVLYIAMPMMSGGMGAGVVPLSGIYADAAGLDKAAIVSQMIPASTIGNVLAILCAALAAKLGRSIPAWDGPDHCCSACRPRHRPQRHRSRAAPLAGLFHPRFSRQQGIPRHPRLRLHDPSGGPLQGAGAGPLLL